MRPSSNQAEAETADPVHLPDAAAAGSEDPAAEDVDMEGSE